MQIKDEWVIPVIEARAAYIVAYEAYLKAAPGRELTIKQGEMQAARRIYQGAACAVFDLMIDETEGGGLK